MLLFIPSSIKHISWIQRKLDRNWGFSAKDAKTATALEMESPTPAAGSKMREKWQRTQANYHLERRTFW